MVTDDASYARNALDAIWSSENEDPKRLDPLIIFQTSSLGIPFEF